MTLYGFFVLLDLCRVCGGGSVTEGVQRFIWDHCLNRAVIKKQKLCTFYFMYLNIKLETFVCFYDLVA